MLRWTRAACVAAAACAVMPVAATAKCAVSKFADIPITMDGRRATVAAQIDGRAARFILDSGAFYSTIARANALEYGLKVGSLGPGAEIRGIGGTSSLGYTRVKSFGIAGETLSNVEFGVGGSDTGYAGLIGQNILGLGDVEYDLPHGTVRLMKTSGCKGVGLAYWAGTKPFTVVDLTPTDVGQRHTIGTVTVNGVKLKALFDTGAMRSLMTLAAARKLGLTPESPGMTPNGFAFGMGQSRVRTWRTRFDAIDIGGELIKRPWIDVADETLDGPDLLIGIDFFQSHHILVDNQNRRMFVTYEGGGVFGLDPRSAVDSTGTALDLTDKATTPTDAAGYGRRGAIFAAAQKYGEAIADFDKAVAMAPGEARYVFQRGEAHLANRQPLLGAADIDKAIALAPGDAEARMVRARLRLRDGDKPGALADLQAADKALAPSSDARMQLGGLYDSVDAHQAALANYDQWLRSHPEDSGRASAFNGRCWARALLNVDLDKALDDCNAALRLRPGEGAYLDSRALVRLRRGEIARAIGDYDAAVAARPRDPWPLYARSLAERRAGDVAKADADRARALAIDPAVAERAKRYRLE